MSKSPSSATPSLPDDEPMLQPPCAILRRFLKNQGLKFTTERALILDAVLNKEGVFEVEELAYEMRQAGHRVSKATIYRTVKHLVEAGLIEEVLLDARQAHYQVSYGREPPDHILNLETDQIIEFHSPELRELRDRICAEHGLKSAGHRFLIYAMPEDEDAESE